MEKMASFRGILGQSWNSEKSQIVICKLAERSLSRGSESDAIVVPSGQNQKCKQWNVCHDLAEKNIF